jgi:uncharacterized membrane protein YphA (DoxX/SURF4 family)
MTVTRLIARPMLASIFFVGGVNALKYTDAHAVKARKITEKVVPLAQRAAPVPSDAATLVRIHAVTQIVAAAALATGRVPRISAGVLAATLVPTTLAGHAFWDESDPETRTTQRTQFVKNTSLLGGLLLAGVDTEGRPGLAWRARRAASDVRRESRRLARDARREARLAKAQLT